MTNHLKIPELLENSGFCPEISLPCQKNFVEGLRWFLKKLILVYDIILIPGIYQNIPK